MTRTVLDVQKVKKHAIALLECQSDVPESPGTLNAMGQPELCLGALIAASAIAVADGEPASRRFQSDLLSSRSTDLIVESMQQLGWSRTYALQKIVDNDAAAPPDRRKVCENAIELLEMA